MTLTDRPVVSGTGHLYPRLITMVVTIDDYRNEAQTLLSFSCSNTAIDDEWQRPVFWAQHMLDADDRGRGVLADLCGWADTDDIDAGNIRIWCDGETIVDTYRRDALSELGAVVARAERAVVNP